jgi:uncharacterized protein with von Willebrand factor type A (vWA) domain
VANGLRRCCSARVTPVLDNLLVFGRLLRNAGLPVGPGRMVDIANALPLVDMRVRYDVYHTCRTLLVSRVEEIPLFDRAFNTFFARLTATGRSTAATPPIHRSEQAASEAIAGDIASIESAEPAGETPTERGMWSDAGGIANKDFAAFTDEDIALGRAALARLAWQPAERRTRRWIPGRGPRLDLRRAIARSLRTGGEIVRLPGRRRRTRPRPLVLLCDISGSMERYSRMLVHFAHALMHRYRQVEVFLFSTQLTRITRDVQTKRLDTAIDHVARAVPDWSGGTKIGQAVAQFHQRWARRVLHRGPVVLLISDGWDRGEPSVLRDQMARLQRSSHRVIWLNPLIGSVDYAPLTRGLQAALPFVDDFLPARTLNDLADLTGHLNSLADSRRPRAKVHDPGAGER